MNREELVKEIATNVGVTQTKAAEALESLVNSIKESLNRGEDVKLSGFGTFKVTQRAARKGRNPKTGAEIQIPAKSVAKFKFSSSLKKTL